MIFNHRFYMKAVIVNFRGSRRTRNFSQIILKLNNMDKDKAKELINKDVIWKTSSGKEIKGKITNVHGNSGAVRAKFERGLPGQSLGTEVEVK